MNQGPPAIRPVTFGPMQHFFGYYDKSPWDSGGRYMLAHQTSRPPVMPGPDDAITVGIIDLDTLHFRPLGQSTAWNWQQGCMLQWLPQAGQSILYNDRRDGRFISIIHDLETGNSRHLPLPVYASSHCGKVGYSVNFERLHRWRPITGYAGGDDPSVQQHAPQNDGIWRFELRCDATPTLILSLQRLASFEPQASMVHAPHWIEHLLPSPDDQRLLFLHRWRPRGRRGFVSRMYTINPDGTDLHLLADEQVVSHFDWRSGGEILAWSRHGGTEGFHLYHDRSDAVEPFAPGVLQQDGHCSFSPDRRWLIVDSYPDAQGQAVLTLLRVRDLHPIELARLASPSSLSGDVRCDLHPRFIPDGRQVCIDSAHDGARQMYVLDVADG